MGGSFQSYSRVTYLCVIVSILVGCVSSDQLAIDRAMREYDCPKEKIEVRYLSTTSVKFSSYDIYRVKACGTIATYACSETGGDCVKESDDRRDK